MTNMTNKRGRKKARQQKDRA